MRCQKCNGIHTSDDYCWDPEPSEVVTDEPEEENNLSVCPVCGYHAFNGEECFDCGYKP